MSKAIRTAVHNREAKILHMLLAAAEEEQQRLWAQQRWNCAPLLGHAAAFGSIAGVSILLRAGAGENGGGKENRASDLIGDAFDHGIRPAQEAAIARTLRRGPAYRARSMAWPAEVAGASGRASRAPLDVRIFRPGSDDRFFATRFNR